MRSILLTGFSGTGKTTVGREAARLLDWAFLDTDEEIERRAGRTVAVIFAEEGEAAFRRLEADALRLACSTADTVVATGGGAFVDAENRALMLRSGLVIALEASPDTIGRRLFRGASDGEEGSPLTASGRPLLDAEDPGARVREIKVARQEAYALAHWTVHTDLLSVPEAAREVVRAWSLAGPRLGDGGPETGASAPAELAATVHTSAGACPISVGPGLLDHLGETCRRAGLTGTAYLFSDTIVSFRHGRRAQLSLEAAGIATHTLTLPPGEPTKSVDLLAACYGWLAELHAERTDFVVALGGGVVGDLAGFVAATFNRGMPFVQAPTSLAAMVDASIGGKTAVNLPQGKNLVGAFHQPRLVLADTDTLSTLPPRELASGWAEAIKHGLILDRRLFETFEEHATAIASLERPVATDVIRRSMAIKADVVSRDEHETLGVRTLLNYGHTVGHALEAATEYGELLHGEAVAVGMAAAVRISQRMGLVDAAVVERQARLLERFGLPLHHRGVDPEAVRQAMRADKKTAAGSIRWVLLERVGRAVVRGGVPADVVDAALAEVL